jgi:hypothetical protein
VSCAAGQFWHNHLVDHCVLLSRAEVVFVWWEADGIDRYRPEPATPFNMYGIFINKAKTVFKNTFSSNIAMVSTA